MSGILETLKFLDVTWLHVAVAVDKKLETQSARIAELEAALKKIVEKTRHAHPMSYESGYYRIAHDALEGGKDE